MSDEIMFGNENGNENEDKNENPEEIMLENENGKKADISFYSPGIKINTRDAIGERKDDFLDSIKIILEEKKRFFSLLNTQLLPSVTKKVLELERAEEELLKIKTELFNGYSKIKELEECNKMILLEKEMEVEVERENAIAHGNKNKHSNATKRRAAAQKMLKEDNKYQENNNEIERIRKTLDTAEYQKGLLAGYEKKLERRLNWIETLIKTNLK